ncbi:MAG: AcrB/AcrD/AcrF family protein [Bacteroidetes bacterium]|jgi:HAE1 family hydrophobic/amphiphilic exporter-1|nr:AcrB/AcrD/AcrF family protein [Bacteroidota bacterium]
MTLTQTAMRRPVTTLMVFVCMLLIGGLSMRLIPLELFPEFDVPVVFVQVPYPGSTPEEVERQITRPAEEALATISDVKRMRSTSRENQAEVQLEFNWGVDTDIKAIEAREKLDAVRDQLPADIERIFVGQFSTSDMPILQLRVSSERDLSSAYELLDRKLKRRIERIDGVSKVDLYGVQPREVRIELEADRVAAHRVDLVRLQEQLRGANFSTTAGRITDGGRRYIVRPVGELTTIDQISNLVINERGLRVRDIATVTYDEPERDHGRHLNGTYAVGLNISKEAGSNTVDVTKKVQAALDGLEGDPEMRGINLYMMSNSAEGITSSLRDLLEAGLLGAVLALVVLYFFLRRWSTTLIVALAVPISIVVTVGALYFLGLTLNIMSMMGLMLAVGMLVDNAVVVTENIHRHQHLAASETGNRGAEESKNETPRLLVSSSPRFSPGTGADTRRAATLQGVKEVALAVTAGTITTGIVFLPMIISQADQVTLFLKHVSVAICVALAVSLLISLTVVPLLSARIKPPAPTTQRTLVDKAAALYTRQLDWMLRHRKTSAALILGILLSVAIPAMLVEQDFFPNDNTEREIPLYFHLNDTYTLERVEETVDKVEAYLFAHKEDLDIESVYSYFTPDHAQSTILLTDDGEKSVEELKETIREGLPKIALGTPSFTWESGGGRESIRVTLSGKSSEQLAELAKEVAFRLSRVDGLTDIRSEARAGDREVRVVVDRDRARQYGFSTQQVASTVSAAMRGQNLRRFRTDDGEVEMRLMFQDTDRQTMDQLRALPIRRTRANGSGQISLAALADFEVRRGPRAIQRENRATMIGVTATLEDELTSTEARERIDASLEGMVLPTGYTWGWGQRIQQAEESQAIMLTNLLLALALIYLVMAALFESLMHPFGIWTSILFAVVGVFWFFLMTGTTFSIMAWIGILVLIGVVVNNSIVLVDHINWLRREEDVPRHEAIVRAGRERFRPILMTAATTILGLIPLCIGTTQIGGDGPAYYPMARAIVGGLAFSTFITLVILPVIYLMLDDLRRWSRHVAHVATQ